MGYGYFGRDCDGPEGAPLTKEGQARLDRQSELIRKWEAARKRILGGRREAEDFRLYGMRPFSDMEDLWLLPQQEEMDKIVPGWKSLPTEIKLVHTFGGQGTIPEDTRMGYLNVGLTVGNGPYPRKIQWVVTGALDEDRYGEIGRFSDEKSAISFADETNEPRQVYGPLGVHIHDNAAMKAQVEAWQASQEVKDQ